MLPNFGKRKATNHPSNTPRTPPQNVNTIEEFQIQENQSMVGEGMTNRLMWDTTDISE